MPAKTSLLLAAVVAFPVLFSIPADAGYVTGQDLLDSCSPQPIDPVYRLKVAECRGYVVAIADASDCSHKNLDFKWNSANGTPQYELVNSVVTWLRSHPEVLQYQADGLVAAALAKNFPCNPLTADDR